MVAGYHSDEAEDEDDEEDDDEDGDNRSEVHPVLSFP